MGKCEMSTAGVGTPTRRTSARPFFCTCILASIHTYRQTWTKLHLLAASIRSAIASVGTISHVFGSDLILLIGCTLLLHYFVFEFMIKGSFFQVSRESGCFLWFCCQSTDCRGYNRL
ncbi:unnamed protein product [Protopolystoma xenopodis]|uniref:Uncharacterized protein n=1 Tax=Protopolystoma xenopodis TaxID=117903 RepID=A0A3S5AC06_9PLAT|nr:unnamed protein product [Protopolystoma xenopodis]